MAKFKHTRFSNTVLGSALGVLLGVGSAFGNPTDPTVISGSASFETAGSALNVTNTPGAIIDWNSFSIGRDEITQFIQQSSSSAVLNRVTGGDLSEILGDLQSNGRVFLINPNGLIVGDGASIDTAGFVGSTLDISNQAFLAGQYDFNGDGGTIENRGLIHVSGNGDIALIASSVENAGVLRSDNGDIVLAAGKSVSLSFDGVPNLSFEVQSPENQVTNLGSIIAARGNAALVGSRITNNGNVELVESPDGRIFLQASDLAIVDGELTSNGGDVHVEGTQVELRNASIDTGSDAVAGDISLLGDRVGLFAGTEVNATGNTGGGTILIGGEQQGRGDTRTSEFVYLDRDASVSANGGINGDGGTVILFAENSARIDGNLTARGGEQSGDGGFIETSGLIGLRVNSTPDASATNGAAGTWLIDPNNITVVASDATEAGIEQTTDIDNEVFTAIAGGATILNTTIQDVLMGSNVTIDTGDTGTEDGDITINDSIISGSGNSLTFNAARNITINADVRVTVAPDSFGGPTTLQFNSDQAGTGEGSTIISGFPVIEAGTVEFLGGGLTLLDFSDPDIIAVETNIVGGLEQTGAFLDLIGGDVSIDELILNPGVEGGPVINSDPAGTVTIGTLTANLPASPISNSMIGLLGGDYVLLDGGSIALQLDTSGQVPPPMQAQLIIESNLINQGTLNITGDGVIDLGFNFIGMPSPGGGTLTNTAGAILNIDGGIGIGSQEPIVNNGTININAALGPVLNPGVAFFSGLENNSLLNINPGALLQLRSLDLNQGEVHLDGGGILDLFDDGGGNPIPVNLAIGEGSSITGNGIIMTDGLVSVESGGILAPGNSPGALAFASDLSLFDGAILDIELAGPTPQEFDFIDIMGNLAVGGPGPTAAPAPGVVLNITNLGNYNPDPNLSHDILQVGGAVTQSATPFNQSATGFDTLNVAFNAAGTLGVVVSVAAPPQPPMPPAPPAPPPTAPPANPTPPVVPTPPVEEMPIVEQPEDPIIMDPPDDIINDVIAFEDSRPGFRDPSSFGPTTRSDDDDEIRTLENQCR